MSEYTTDHDLKSYEDLSEIDEARNVFLNEDIPNGVNVIDTIKKLKTLNNMLNSTKTWQDKFEQEYWGKFGSTKTINDIKQFISDLRKRDMEELIKIVTGAWCVELDSDNLIKLIKDYYEN